MEKPAISKEIERAEARRKQLDVRRPEGHAHKQWALCLSGGGIRSATFCLGVLQGLAKSAPPPVVAAADPSSANSQTQNASQSVLSQFDYVSTVSGGGYVGSFFSSLFVKGRLSGDQAETNAAAAIRAYEVLTEEPPERMHSQTVYEPGRPGRAALAWLRDNGRYLAPTGSGDMVYAAGVGIRNWFATQYVIATLVLLALAISLCARVAAATTGWYGSIEAILRHSHVVWWSSAWVLVVLALLIGVVPAGVGFWFTYPPKGKSVTDPSEIVTQSSLIAMFGGVGACLLGIWGVQAQSVGVWPKLCIAIGAFILAGVVCLAVTKWRLRPASISQHRVVITRLLSQSLLLTAMFAALAAVETIAQTVAPGVQDGRSIISTSSIVAALVWLTRFVAQRMDEKSAGGLLKKIPWPVLAGVVAVLLWLVLAVLYDLLLLWIVSNGQPVKLFSGVAVSQVHLVVAGCTVVFLFAFALATGQFPGFLNLSTFQGLYSARLTRAYLGASNHRRFENENKWRSVAEPAPGDNLKVDELYASPLAPIHYINVCVNQNIDPSEQLVQRDRKGKPFVLAPPHGFYLDGEPCAIPDGGSGSELASALTVGEWVGVSGAAFTTGLGRSTSLGGSLLLGFANVRLGRWWYSGCAKVKEKFWRRKLGTQLYLLDEIRSRFYGTRLPYQYLSDGGHFENTAAYEMVRPGRNIALLVICDCGADPEYQFDDLANLIRLARIDHGVEIVVNREVAKHDELKRCFGVPEDFKRGTDGRMSSPDRCAMLLDVYSPPIAGARLNERSLSARIILVKPAMLSDVAADVQNYLAQYPAFPQEPTSDQFFDEAQWESYRKLGLQVACRVFPQRVDDERYAKAFWEAVLVP